MWPKKNELIVAEPSHTEEKFLIFTGFYTQVPPPHPPLPTSILKPIRAQ